MGIEIVMSWKGETEDERKDIERAMDRSIVETAKNWTVGRFNVPGVGRTALGHVGYLFEAYHGEPYATTVLLPEVTEPNSPAAKIPAAIMRSRLADAMAACRMRARVIYGYKAEAAGDALAKSFADFVDLAERKEAETGEPVTVKGYV